MNGFAKYGIYDSNNPPKSVQEPGQEEVNDVPIQKILNPFDDGYDQMATSFNDFSKNSVYNEEILDPCLEIESMEFKKIYPVSEHYDNDLDLSKEIKSMNFENPPLASKDADIIVPHQPFNEIPQPSQVKRSILESIRLEIEGVMFPISI
jgi:hypothetical protein